MKKKKQKPSIHTSHIVCVVVVVVDAERVSSLTKTRKQFKSKAFCAHMEDMDGSLSRSLAAHSLIEHLWWMVYKIGQSAYGAISSFAVCYKIVYSALSPSLIKFN